MTGEGIAQAIEYGVARGQLPREALAGDVRPVDVVGGTSRCARSRLARDLRIRTGFVQPLLRPRRAREVERFFTESPTPLHVGCQHFAAQPYDWLTVGEVVARRRRPIAAAIGVARPVSL